MRIEIQNFFFFVMMKKVQNNHQHFFTLGNKNNEQQQQQQQQQQSNRHSNKLTSTFETLRRKYSNRRSSLYPGNSGKAQPTTTTTSSDNDRRRNIGGRASVPANCCIVPTMMHLDRPVMLLMDEIGFTNDELKCLRQQFECLKQQRDEVAGEIYKCIQINFKISPIQDAHHNKWSTLGLGVTLLSGYERIINRLDKPQYLSLLMRHIVESHNKSKHVSTSEMRRLVAVSKQIVMPYICPCRQSTDNQMPTQNCEIHDLWSKFFLLLIGLISSAEIQLEQEGDYKNNKDDNEIK